MTETLGEQHEELLETGESSLSTGVESDLPAATSYDQNLEEDGLTKDKHFHHWRLEEPNGRTSHGECKDCGEHKDFKNWLENDGVTSTEHRLMRSER